MNDNIEKLNAIRTFEEDWNGYGAEPIPEDIINRCECVVKLLNKQLELFPTGRKTIQFEHEFKDKTYIEFEIFENKIGVLLVPKREYSNGIDIDLPITEPEKIAFFINGCIATFGYDEMKEDLNNSENNSTLFEDTIHSLSEKEIEFIKFIESYPTERLTESRWATINKGENNMKEIKIKYFTDKIEKLKYIGGSKRSNWIDLRAAETMELKANNFYLIPLGVAMKLPEGYEAHIAPRSSTFKTWGIIQCNSVGVVDESYCGDTDQWLMPVYATRDTTINVNDRVCQFRIMENQPTIEFIEVKQMKDESRGGIGSSGKQ